MVGITEISAGLSSLKAGLSILKGLNAAATQASINEVKVELTQHILDAQQALTAAYEAQATTAERIRQLEQEIVSFKDWEATKQRYELNDAGQGALAYSLKEGVEPSERHHWICPQCYEDGVKSLLKHEHLVAGRAEILVCHRCGLDLAISGRRAPPPTVVGSRISPLSAPPRR